MDRSGVWLVTTPEGQAEYYMAWPAHDRESRRSLIGKASLMLAHASLAVFYAIYSMIAMSQPSVRPSGAFLAHQVVAGIGWAGYVVTWIIEVRWLRRNVHTLHRKNEALVCCMIVIELASLVWTIPLSRGLATMMCVKAGIQIWIFVEHWQRSVYIYRADRMFVLRLDQQGTVVTAYSPRPTISVSEDNNSNENDGDESMSTWSTVDVV